MGSYSQPVPAASSCLQLVTWKFKALLLISTELFSLYSNYIATSMYIETFWALASDTTLHGARELPVLTHTSVEADGEMQPALLITGSSIVNNC